MPWTGDGAVAGFTSAPDAWLPLDPRHRALAADTQEHDPNSVLAFTRAAIALRRGSAAFREGEFVALDAPEPVLAFERRSGGERVLCVFNLGADAVRRPLPAGATALFTVGTVETGAAAAQLGPFSALIAAL
jgi:alpha-glucosidase